MAERRAALSLAAFSFLLVLSIVLCLAAGSTELDWSKAFKAGTVDNIILFTIRLPRVLAAALAGLAFAISGLLLQVASANALASPNIIGVNSGAGFAVLLFLCFLPQHYALLPLVSFLGAVTASLAVFALSALSSRMPSSSSLILAGVAVNALFNAAISTLSSLESEVMSSYSAFSVGGFASVQASAIVVPGIIIAVASATALPLGHILDVMRLGDEIASSLGYRPMRLRLFLTALSCLLAASAVSFAGLLGFVGLVTPHLAGFITGGGGKRTLALSALIGPTLVLLADLLGRTAVAPGELPAGIFMAALGVPCFIFLLLRRSRHA